MINNDSFERFCVMKLLNTGLLNNIKYLESDGTAYKLICTHQKSLDWSIMKQNDFRQIYT